MPNKNQSQLKNILVLNLGVLIIATSGILAKYMSLFPPFLTWARCFIAFCTIAIYLFFTNRKALRFPFRDKDVLISGSLLCLHWVLFYYSIELATVAIAAISIFTYPIMTTLLAPLFHKTKLEGIHILLGLFILGGIYIISPEISLQNDVFIGVLCGLGSALAYAIRNILSKNLVTNYDGLTIVFYQVGIVSFILLPFSTHHDFNTIQQNILPILVLGIVPTIIGHSILVESFKHFSASKAGILTSFQPVYAIVLAILFLGENPSIHIYIGGFIIMMSVLFEIGRKSK